MLTEHEETQAQELYKQTKLLMTNMPRDVVLQVITNLLGHMFVTTAQGDEDQFRRMAIDFGQHLSSVIDAAEDERLERLEEEDAGEPVRT